MYNTLAYGKKDQLLPLELVWFVKNHRTENYYRPTGNHLFQWLYCLKGEGKITVLDQTYKIIKGDGILIFPNEAYDYVNISDDWELDRIEFTGAACREILASIGMTETGVYRFSNHNVFHKHVSHIEKMCQKNPPAEAEDVSVALYAFLMDISKSVLYLERSKEMDEIINDNKLLMLMMDYIEKNYAINFSLDEMAAGIGLSKNYMCMLFKKNTGRTIVTELTYVRMAHARTYLVQHLDKSVVEIAHMCGYEDAGYFGKLFKKIVGETPDQFRRKR